MNIRINREVLIKPLSSVVGIVEKRQALPILSNLLLVGNANKLTFTATDLEMQTSLNIDTKIETDFEITISARKLFDITRALPENTELDFQINESRVNVKAGKSKFNLQTLPSKDYPLLKKNDSESVSVKLSQNKLKGLLKQVDFAMAQQDIRYYLNGLLFEIQGQKLNIVGTDGHRLSFTSTKLDDSYEKKEVIIPRKTIMELIKLLNDSDEIVELEILNQQVTFKFGDIFIITKVIDGKFPDYNRVIPVGYENGFLIERQMLLNAMQRASILSNEKYRGIRLVLSENNMQLITTNSEQEEAQEDIEISYNKEAIDIGFNVTYLIDVLNNIQFDQLSFAFKDSNSSCLVTIPNNDDYKYVVMPMRI
ncbi:DNA polymerase III subunit beta [Methylophilales bacterium MBRSG12]|uniref:Beta sliding clamp n=1 Tax=Methylophilales bacterium MBRS-H7 TaxID=1623450 RepID=A0A0H4J1B5_9PROT|nr:DNA polymerase III subunit beta [Methylophilales bacterium MBRSF5]AKO65810.1 DNA polymerase III subunit beta [Methylophilales bacterium MBRS-H7]AKO67130.1 DNA polymerase III subunit beta [Methylophilales bacterium MBRSG12]